MIKLNLCLHLSCFLERHLEASITRLCLVSIAFRSMAELVSKDMKTCFVPGVVLDLP